MNVSPLRPAALATPIPVSVDNFVRAESDMYFGHSVHDAGGIGRFHHHREPMAIDHQTVIRANRDTLYSTVVLDLDAGPATLTLPDAGGRFMSLLVIDEDQYTRPAIYEPGAYTFSRENVDTRYVLLGIRTLVDPRDPADLATVCALQDAISVVQPGGPGRWEPPAWDLVSQKTVRGALVQLAATLPDTKRMFGAKEEVDPVRFLIGSATGWGGNPERDAVYLTVVPARNDGVTPHRLTLKDVPVDGFWSVSVYNSSGYFERNDRDAYSVNSVTAERGPDGSVEIQFGECEGVAPNCIPITPGWNYWVRLYRPRPEVLDGRWTLPEAQPL